MKCPEGMIERVGYKAVRSATNKAYKVKPSCVPDTGKPGKTPPEQRIPSVEEFDMSVYGYTNLASMKADDRHSALREVIKGVISSEGKDEHDAAVKVMRRLNYLFVLTRNSQPTLSKKLEADRNWIGRTYLGKDYSSKL